MDTFKDETEFTHFHMQRVIDMFDGRPSFQQIVRLGILANMGYGNDQDDLHEDVYEYDDWIHGRAVSHGYPRLSDRNSDRGLSESRSRSSSSLNQPPLRHYASAHDLLPPSVNAQTKESSTERKAGLLEETKNRKGKAERKRLKKQKQKERKRLEKQEKEKQNPVKDEEEGDDAQQSKAKESKPVNKSENSTSSSVKASASAKDTDSSDSSEDETSEDGDAKNDSGDSEELDMASTFVTKAALIARRQLQQKPGPERKEKKKTPDKEKDKPKEDLELGKKDSAASSSLTLEDNIKISTDLANTGNKFASEGDFNMAVKYFTDAIRYNPTEFKLFGNRSFCFEKMQEYTKALADAEVSLSMCPGWVKGLFRKGRALAGLKRYQEAAQAFREVLKMDSSCAEAAQELMRVQITQLMGFGYTREQSSNALIIHGTVNKALEVLSDLNRPGANKNGTLSPPQVANISGVSPVLSASTGPAPPRPPHHQSHNAPKPPPFKNKPLGPVQNMSNVQSRPKPPPDHAMKTKNEDNRPSQELFPVWVGNLIYPVNETTLTNLFNKVGVVYSVKVLSMKRCAFVNFTKQEHCDEAIRRFHGFELSGVKLAVRYPDRIPPGMGISKSALKAEDLYDENVRQNGTSDWAEASGNRGPVRHYKQGPNFRGNDKN